MAQHAIVLKDLAIYPDVLAWDPNYRTVEFPRHFDDSDIPHKIRDVLVGSTDYALGVVPWAAENATANLTTALAENWDDFSEYLKDPMKISYPIRMFNTTRYCLRLLTNCALHLKFLHLVCSATTLLTRHSHCTQPQITMASYRTHFPRPPYLLLSYNMCLYFL